MVHPIWNDFPEVAQGLEAVERLIRSELKIKSPEIKQRIDEYMTAPGKYMRAGLSLLFQLIRHGEINESSLYIASAIEVLHLATLIHDDVIDDAALRRGISTLQTSHSNRIAIYTGDYLMVYAGRLLAKSERQMPQSYNFSWAMEGILSGEIQQLVHQFDDKMTLNKYLRQIRGKTALLFALSTFSGYFDINSSSRKNKQAFYIGEKIGMVFQLTDDIIDFQLKQNQSGKPRMQDIQNGIYTAPLLFSLKSSNIDLASLSKEKEWTPEKLDEILLMIDQGGGIELTQALINQYVVKIKNQLKKLEGNLKFKKQVEDLIELMRIRTY